MVDGIAGWFDCALGAAVSMTNSPLTNTRIDRSQAFFPLLRRLSMKAGETLDITFRIRHDPLIIAWTVTERATGQSQSMSTWKSKIISPADLARDIGQVIGPIATGRARRAFYELLDGSRNAAQIEAALAQIEPPLFPSPEELNRFVRAELAVGGA